MYGSCVREWEKMECTRIIDIRNIEKIVMKVIQENYKNRMIENIKFIDKIREIVKKIEREENVENELNKFLFYYNQNNSNNNNCIDLNEEMKEGMKEEKPIKPISIILRIMELVKRYGRQRIHLMTNDRMINMYLEREYGNMSEMEKKNWIEMTLNEMFFCLFY